MRREHGMTVVCRRQKQHLDDVAVVVQALQERNLLQQCGAYDPDSFCITWAIWAAARRYASQGCALAAQYMPRVPDLHRCSRRLPESAYKLCTHLDEG